MCRRSLNGRRIREEIHVLGACNPYRLRPKDQGQEGLAFQLHNAGQEEEEDEMSRLVYRVQKVPETILEFVFDFGILSQHMEKIYIRSMVGRHFTQQGINVPDAKLDVFADLLHTAQLYVREVEVRRRTSI